MPQTYKLDATHATLELEQTACPLCGSHSDQELCCLDRFDMGIRTVYCQDCGLVFTNPRPTDSSLQSFYKDSYRKLYTGHYEPSLDYDPFSPVYRRSRFHLKLLSQLWDHQNQKASPSVLDIGCGAGVLLHLLRKKYKDANLFGVEPDRLFASFASKLSRSKVFAEKMDSWFFRADFSTARFDFIVLGHVLEHLVNPTETLKQIRSFLKPNGYLLIEVPNVFSHRWQNIRDIFHIAHLTHFSPYTLGKILERSGYQMTQTIVDKPLPQPWAMIAIAGPRTVPTGDGKISASDLNQIQFLKERISSDKNRKSLPAHRIQQVIEHYGMVGAFAKGLSKAWLQAQERSSPVVSKLFDYPISLRRAQARRKRHEALHQLIHNQNILIVGSGPSSLYLTHIPKGVKIFTCNQSFRVLERSNLSNSIDLYMSTWSKIKRLKSLDEMLPAFRVQMLLTDRIGQVSKNLAQRSPQTSLFEDDGTDPFYLESLIGREMARSIRGKSFHPWTSTGIRLLQYALYYGAKNIGLSGIDFGHGGYAWNKKPITWYHKDMDERFFEIVRSKQKNLFHITDEATFLNFSQSIDFSSNHR